MDTSASDRVLDKRGERLRKGDRVRIAGMPRLQVDRANDVMDTWAVFEHLQGSVRTIGGIDKEGMVEINFILRRGRLAGMHSVYIEPWLLLRQKRMRKG